MFYIDGCQRNEQATGNRSIDYSLPEIEDTSVHVQSDSSISYSKIRLVEAGEYKWFVSSLDDGEIISEKYEDAYPFDAQNTYARVMKDGKWGLINSDFELVLPCEYDYINTLLDVYVHATGVKDGAAVIIKLPYLGYDQEEIRITELPAYSDIGEMWLDYWCYVKDSKGRTGIIKYDGTELLAPEYKSISKEAVVDEDTYIFSVEDYNGHYRLILLCYSSGKCIDINS